MGTSAVPALIDAIVTAADAALSCIVSDGFGVTEDPGDYLMIGVVDPDSDFGSEAATSEQSWASIGAQSRDEVGDITCAALSWNGNADAKGARDAVYATLAALSNLLRATPALGLATVLWTGFGEKQELTQNQSGDGAMALVVFTIHFRARI